MERTLIQQYSSTLVKNLIESVDSLGRLGHTLTKGQLRELFVAQVLNNFLTIQFGIGTGIIVNQKGNQSAQTDIVIYDKRIIPPFIEERGIGVYPAESVIATIEVKSWLNKGEIESADKAATKLKDEIYDPNSSIYEDFGYLKPLCTVIGFYNSGENDLLEVGKGKEWLSKNIRSLFGICLVSKYSWLHLRDDWAYQGQNEDTKEETKRFIAVTLDNVRTHAELRLRDSEQRYLHRDFLGAYIRDQEAIRQYFDSQ